MPLCYGEAPFLAAPRHKWPQLGYLEGFCRGHHYILRCIFEMGAASGEKQLS
jgi:hypothetical protein